ncbi:MAG: arginine--tRNA ligase [Methanobacteriota archaeon]|nr:MAG: arginine--tRNA ligase [Euryarchaeota archaeon]
MKDKLEELINQYLQEIIGNTKPIKLEKTIKSLSDKADYAFIINPIAKTNDPIAFAENLGSQLIQSIPMLESFFVTENQKGKHTLVFLNLKVDPAKQTQFLAEEMKQTIEKILSNSFGRYETHKGKTVIVEHTSANPIAPLHVGNLRNSIQGDTFARLLQATGYDVRRHFYVNDVGLQIGFTIIGYEILKKKEIYPDIKFDHWIGKVYAIMNAFYTIQSIKTKAKKEGIPVTAEDYSQMYMFTPQDIEKIQMHYENKIQQLENEIIQLEASKQKKKIVQLNRTIVKLKEEANEANKYQNTLISLKNRFPDLFEPLNNEISKFDLIEKTSAYLEKYERGDDEHVNSLFREVANWALSSFKWTLKRFNIEFDQFDFESDITWSGLPKQLVKKMQKFSNTKILDDGSTRFTYPSDLLNKMYKELKINKKSIPFKSGVPDLQLTRSDGTALYPMKDIAYSIRKFEKHKPEKVFNVISDEQALPQFQMLLPLYQLGYKNIAKNLIHYSYGLVELLGRKMSGRQAIYITADEYYDETKVRARLAKKASSRQLQDESWEEEEEILTAVTLASTRFPLVETDPNKKIVLDLDRELDFKRNSGPFVLYAHARASGILRKAEITPSIEKVNFLELAKNKDVSDLIETLSSFKEKVHEAVELMNPSKIANWCVLLSQQFMKFYEKNPILKADNEMKNNFLVVVAAVKKGLSKGLELLGIPSVERI